jgi:hypothetical protein
MILALVAVRKKQIGFKKARRMLNVPTISLKRNVNMKD